MRLPAAPTIVEIGAGTGTLARALARALPGARIVATDRSARMLAEAQRAADADPALAARIAHRTAPAEALGLPDGSADLVVGAFVHQLVRDRGPVHAECLRVLRPGGALALVTWQAGGALPDAARAFDDVVADSGCDVPVPGHAPERRAGDLASPDAAARELRRAGLRRGAARATALRTTWDAPGYLALKEAYDEAALFAALAPADRDRLRGAAAAAFARLPPDAFVWTAPLVSVVARRPGVAPGG
ncbi:MAG: class I SAM-dependent methyltransferase [Chloroflexota bacterium]